MRYSMSVVCVMVASVLFGMLGLSVQQAEALTITENFDAMPTWSSQTTGGSPTWTNNLGGGVGGTGNFLKCTQTGVGTSSRVKVYSGVATNTDYALSCWMKAASYAASYWTEVSVKGGSNTASDFDGNSGTWTLIQKFSDSGGYPNGDLNVWTQYTKSWNSGSATQISVGYKLGRNSGVAVDARWDSFLLTESNNTPTNTSTSSNTPTISNTPTDTPSYPVPHEYLLNGTMDYGTAFGGLSNGQLPSGWTKFGTSSTDNWWGRNNSENWGAKCDPDVPTWGVRFINGSTGSGWTTGWYQRIYAPTTGWYKYTGSCFGETGANGQMGYAIGTSTVNDTNISTWTDLTPCSQYVSWINLTAGDYLCVAFRGVCPTGWSQFAEFGMFSVLGPDPPTPTNTPTYTDTPYNTSTSTDTFTDTLSPTPLPCSYTQCFNVMPSWNSSHDASWGGAATWSIVAGGQEANALQSVRSNNGSSAKVLVYSVGAGSDLDLSIYTRCPNGASGYWMECGYKLGTNTATDFNEGSGWTMIKKFDSSTANNNTWTQYSVIGVNTGVNTAISIGYKLGGSGGTNPTVGWDSFQLTETAATATSTPVDTATNTPVDTDTNTPVDTDTFTPVDTATDTAVDTATDTPVDTATPTLYGYGDADRNRFVNMADFRNIKIHFGQTTCGEGDCNNDCFVNVDDYRSARDNFGETYPQ